MAYRILYYNWAPYFETPIYGGGVSIYCSNLIDYLTQTDSFKVNFLYSGFDYTYLHRHAYIKQVRNKRHPQVPSFSIVNSPITAPSQSSFHDPIGNIQNPEIEKMLSTVSSRTGTFPSYSLSQPRGINC